jgi:hypothetical protein
MTRPCVAAAACVARTSIQALVSLAADLDWAKQQGVVIERFNLAQQPMDFVQNATVKAFLERSGAEALPLVLVDGEVALAGRYPNRAELTRWAGLVAPAATPALAEVAPAGSCCAGGRCC